MKPAKKPPAQPSAKLVKMLQAATPQQREEAIRARKNKKADDE